MISARCPTDSEAIGKMHKIKGGGVRSFWEFASIKMESCSFAGFNHYAYRDSADANCCCNDFVSARRESDDCRLFTEGGDPVVDVFQLLSVVKIDPVAGVVRVSIRVAGAALVKGGVNQQSA